VHELHCAHFTCTFSTLLPCQFCIWRPYIHLLSDLKEMLLLQLEATLFWSYV
jgi:hypothetical protein